ncbi:carbohydrate ABC transporter permease [Halapricum salinum]|uniref:Sugar ABC transporter permease n=1 Tax=Halapricum salinum TaxID=1457250 RepID=A0A4D6HBJ6_9EURY|nr:sugar ABC transporter permease [Halapricum salinum]QCC51373.1 sugar ABC transporter permease [Halapricum salinum]
MSTVSDVAQRFKESDLASVLEENSSAALVLPGLLLWSMFMLLPMMYIFVLSLTNARPANIFVGNNRLLGLVPLGEADIIGLENYIELLFSIDAANSIQNGAYGAVFDLFLSDPIAVFNYPFWNSFLVTWAFVIVSVTGKVLLGIAIAMIMTGNRVRGKRYLRGIIIMPMGVPVIFSILIWRFVFSNARFGLMNQFLIGIGAVDEAVPWLTDRWLAFSGYVVTEMWLAYPFMVLITVSALQNVNGDLLDAAEVDGAGFFSRMRHVILPSIKRPVMFGTILTSAASFQQFLIPWVFNSGGPSRENELLLVYAYREAFAFSAYGKGAAISLTALFFIGMFMWVAVKRGNLAEEAGES